MTHNAKQAEVDYSSLGNVARIFGDVPDADIRRAVEHQRRHPHLRLGEVMVELGILTQEALAELLRRQQRVRCTTTHEDAAKLLEWASAKLRAAAPMADLAEVVGKAKAKLGT
jgi:hypothetical protein